MIRMKTTLQILHLIKNVQKYEELRFNKIVKNNTIISNNFIF